MPHTVDMAELEKIIDACQIQVAIFWGKEMFVSYLLPSGFTVTGRSACVDPTGFDYWKGRELARRDALRQYAQFRGYQLQLELSGIL